MLVEQILVITECVKRSGNGSLPSYSRPGNFLSTKLRTRPKKWSGTRCDWKTVPQELDAKQCSTSQSEMCHHSPWQPRSPDFFFGGYVEDFAYHGKCKMW